MWCSATFRISKSRNHPIPPNYAAISIRFTPFLFSVPVTMPCLFLRFWTCQTASHTAFITMPHTFLGYSYQPPRQANATSSEQEQHMTGFWVQRWEDELRTANFHSPPKSLLLSKQVGSRSSSKQHLIEDRPLTPAPITATFLAMVHSVWRSRKALYSGIGREPLTSLGNVANIKCY